MGSQIICIDKEEVIGQGIMWDPATYIHMQSVNGSLNQTQGLARNVLLMIGSITIYGQLHVIKQAPYKMLLGRLFDVLTKMCAQTFEDSRMDITLMCPNTWKQITMGTYERGKEIKLEPIQEPKIKDMAQPDGPPSNQDQEQHGNGDPSDQLNFQRTSRNC
ncbi:hypothetical protein Moror_11149 [Moniliophthora roreri MCA 2997]|uniref:Uncharacterized protein n=2 Tax=Moniliophthora roreri TaxID=221103 RepID=V2WMY4_MONRO|nr:hypothetical protein Moror_11149 [Moniliophthora roreri MCA 2997]